LIFGSFTLCRAWSAAFVYGQSDLEQQRENKGTAAGSSFENAAAAPLSSQSK
jgi:hypothetical protein